MVPQGVAPLSLGDEGGFYFFAAVLGLLGLSGVVVVFFLPLPRDSGRFRFLVPPPAGYFPAMESNQRSPGLRARTRGRGAAE